MFFFLNLITMPYLQVLNWAPQMVEGAVLHASADLKQGELHSKNIIEANQL